MAERVQTAIEEVLSGHIEAYAEVVRAHQDEIWRIAAFALRDVAATEDLVQQVFVQAYRSLGDYDAERDFGVWLRSIARNLARNEVRRTMREHKALRTYRAHLVERLGEEAEQYYEPDVRDEAAPVEIVVL